MSFFKNLFIFQLILFIILLIAWNVIIPFLEGADEQGHLCHADYIAHRDKIPNLNIKDGCFLVYQPLYYLTLVPIIKAFNLPEIQLSSLPVNPNWERLRNGEYSQYVHTTSELYFRWDKLNLLVHALRLVSVTFAILIFIIAWKVLNKVFLDKNKRYFSLLLFFNPMFLHIFSTITNVTLITLITSVFIALDILYAKKPKPHKITLIQGLLFGLGIITKISILGLSFAYLFIFLRSWREFKQSLSSKILEASSFLGGIAIAGGWYIARSQILYGEPFEINVARSYAGEHHWTLLSKVGPLNFWHSFADTFFRTFWSGYGALTINFPPVVNTFLLVITLVTIIGAVKSYKKAPKVIKLCFYYVISAFIGLVIVNVRTSSMHAKDIFIAYLPICILFTYGLINIKEMRSKKTLSLKYDFLIFTLSSYFFAKDQIVEVLKFTFGKSSVSLSTFSVIFFKIIVTYFLIKAAKYLIKSFKPNELYIKNLTVILFLINSIIIAISTYLFYYKFI